MHILIYVCVHFATSAFVTYSKIKRVHLHANIHMDMHVCTYYYISCQICVIYMCVCMYWLVSLLVRPQQLLCVRSLLSTFQWVCICYRFCQPCLRMLMTSQSQSQSMRCSYAYFTKSPQLHLNYCLLVPRRVCVCICVEFRCHTPPPWQ